MFHTVSNTALENIADPALLARTAAYARERDLPIVAVKAGRTASGQKAASSHTGSLANEDRVVDAFLRHHGIWRARDTHALVLSAQGYLKGWRPPGGRLVVVSNSGASCVMAADMADELGLPLADLAPTTRDEVAQKLPGFATADNPIDITAALLSNSGFFGDVLPVVARDPAADLFFINVPVAGTGYDVETFARETAAFEAITGKPVAVAAWQAPVAAPFKARGIATFENETEALAVLHQVAGHTALMRRARPVWPQGAAPELAAGPPGFLHEADSLALLARHGVPVVAHRLCRSAPEARQAVAELASPVVVKACSVDVPHKSEHGLVALNVRSANDAAALFNAQWEMLHTLGAARDGIIVAEQRRGRHEFMVGARHDPLFGPVVVIGDGGKYVEALQDIVLLMPPFDTTEVVSAMQRLRIAPLFAGVRGDPPLDVYTLAAVTVAVGQLVTNAGGRIASIDLNPVMVGAAGEGAWVVDALVERA